MSFLDKFLSFFKPNSFENDTYGWLTNQISHTAFSFTVIYLLSYILNYHYVLVFGVAFWLWWEYRHYKESKDLKDCLEDLFFENIGLFIFVKTIFFLPIFFLVLIWLLINRIKKEWNY